MKERQIQKIIIKREIERKIEKIQCAKIRTNNNNNQPWTKQSRNKAWNIKCKKGKEYIKSNNDNNNNNQPWTTTKKQEPKQSKEYQM